MLSYLHAYHAGNHADALKHVVLVALLDALTAKEKPLRYIETHAGAGGYDLRSAAAQKTREWESGIGKLWRAEQPPAAVARLLELVRRFNGGGERLVRYPGSPWLARQCLRPEDSAYLFELHPAEHRALAASTKDDGRVRVRRQNGLVELVGLVPPPERRALVLVDPSYENDGERDAALTALSRAHRRFATGVYALWYPIVERRFVDALERGLAAAALEPFALLELSIRPDTRGRGLTGSGMIVVNPPWGARERLAEALPWLARTLGG